MKGPTQVELVSALCVFKYSVLFLSGLLVAAPRSPGVHPVGDGICIWKFCLACELAEARLPGITHFVLSWPLCRPVPLGRHIPRVLPVLRCQAPVNGVDDAWGQHFEGTQSGGIVRHYGLQQHRWPRHFLHPIPLPFLLTPKPPGQAHRPKYCKSFLSSADIARCVAQSPGLAKILLLPAAAPYAKIR